MMANPHSLVEGMHHRVLRHPLRTHAYIYMRGEVRARVRRLQAAVDEAYARGLPRQEHPRLRLRPRHRGPRRRGRLHLRRGDRAAGLAGGQARPASAQAAVPGRRGPLRLADRRSTTSRRSPRCPRIVHERRRLVRGDGHREVHGLRHLLALRARDRPGPVRGAARHHAARAARHGRRHARPATSSSSGPRAARRPRCFTDEHLDVPLDFESVGAAGSMLGTTRAADLRRDHCVVRAVLRWTEFYEHESCGKCTPVPRGQLLARAGARAAGHGQGTEEDLDTILDIGDNILGRSFCALGDGATSPDHSARSSTSATSTSSTSTLGGCPFDHAASPRSFDSKWSTRMTSQPDPITPERRSAAHRRRDTVTLDHRRHRGERAQGHADHPGRRALGHRDSAVLRPPAAGAGRRLPAVPGRGPTPATAADAQAAGLLHDDGRRRAWS